MNENDFKFWSIVVAAVSAGITAFFGLIGTLAGLWFKWQMDKMAMQVQIVKKQTDGLQSRFEDAIEQKGLVQQDLARAQGVAEGRDRADAREDSKAATVTALKESISEGEGRVPVITLTEDTEVKEEKALEEKALKEKPLPETKDQ